MPEHCLLFSSLVIFYNNRFSFYPSSPPPPYFFLGGGRGWLLIKVVLVLPVLYVLGAEDVVGGDAGLAQVDPLGPHQPAGAELQVRRRINIDRALAAQLQRHRGQVLVGRSPRQQEGRSDRGGGGGLSVCCGSGYCSSVWKSFGTYRYQPDSKYRYFFCVALGPISINVYRVFIGSVASGTLSTGI